MHQQQVGAVSGAVRQSVISAFATVSRYQRLADTG